MKNQFIIILICLYSSNSVGQSRSDSTINYIKPLFKFKYSDPVFALKNGQLANKRRFLRFSAISGYREGIEPVKGFINMGSRINNEQGTVRVFWINSSIQDILANGPLKSNQVVLEVRDPSKYRYDISQGSKIEWMRKHTFCIELLYPVGFFDFEDAKQERLKFFDVNARWEVRNTDVLIIKSKQNSKPMDKYKSLYKELSKRLGSIQLLSINDIVESIETVLSLNVIDETQSKELLLVSSNFSDAKRIQDFQGFLSENGFELQKAKRELKLFVITERGFKND